MPDLARLQRLKPGTVRHALIALAEDGFVEIRQGTTAMVIGEPGPDDNPGGQPARARLGHDCRLSGCKPHACKPMARSTIRNIHAILSGAFDAAQRWEWISLNIKAIRHYTASQMLAEGFDLGNTAARLGHSGGAPQR